MSLGRRLWEAVRANLNALLDEAKAREEGRPHGSEPSAEAPAGDRAIAQAYANLELPFGADLAAVKKQYRRLMARYHPDKHQADAEKAKVAHVVAAELTRAYEAIVEWLERRDRP